MDPFLVDPPDPFLRRARLRDATLMLVFTPEASGGRDAMTALERLLPEVDVVQVRPKPLGDAAPGGTPAVTSARGAAELVRAVLARTRDMERPPLVLVNDRVDVALALLEEGLAGVHVGADDMPPIEARELLGTEPLLGFSTHSLDEIVAAGDLPVDYLGFGPIHATATKGYGRGLGPEVAWVAAATAAVPVFPIGGIDATNIDDLATVGRAAVGSALLAAADPVAAARDLRQRLTGHAY